MSKILCPGKKTLLNKPKKGQLLKTLSEKEKMLVTGISSNFPQCFFYTVSHGNCHMSYNYSLTCPNAFSYGLDQNFVL